MRANLIASVRDLRILLNSINVLVSEARLHFTDNGLNVRAVDYANVAMVAASIRSDVFESYSIAEKFKTGIDVVRLSDFCKSLESKAKAELTVMDRKLILTSGNVTYTIALIDPEAIRKEPNVPQLSLSAEVVMDAKEFKKAISTVEMIDDDEVVFEKTDAEFRIAGEGNVERISCIFGKSKLIKANDGKAKARYSLEYLKSFCKIAGDAEILRIRFDNDYICWLKFEIKDGFEIDYILAPRRDRE